MVLSVEHEAMIGCVGWKHVSSTAPRCPGSWNDYDTSENKFSWLFVCLFVLCVVKKKGWWKELSLPYKQCFFFLFPKCTRNGLPNQQWWNVRYDSIHTAKVAVQILFDAPRKAWHNDLFRRMDEYPKSECSNLLFSVRCNFNLLLFLCHVVWRNVANKRKCSIKRWTK